MRGRQYILNFRVLLYREEIGIKLVASLMSSDTEPKELTGEGWVLLDMNSRAYNRKD